MSQVQSSSVAPVVNEYGGDEINAIVLDPGYASIRAGFAGEDVPKSILPTYYGSLPSPSSSGSTQQLFGENVLHLPKPGLEIRNPINADGTVEDWDTASKLWEYSVTSRLVSPRQGDPRGNGLNDSNDRKKLGQKPSGDGGQQNGDEETNGDAMDLDELDDAEKPLGENPILMTEGSINAPKAREKMLELAMESWGVPAFWLARTAVCAAFAQGKSQALVVDVGASHITVTPVHDGLILKKGMMRSPLGGSFISSQIRSLLASPPPLQSQPQSLQRSPIALTPHYLITAKTPVEPWEPPQAIQRTYPFTPTPSFHAYQEEKILHEFKESVVEVYRGPGRLLGNNNNGASSGPSNEEVASRTLTPRPFEMPDGWNGSFGVERLRIAEGLWDASAALPSPSSSSSTPPPPSHAPASNSEPNGDAKSPAPPPSTPPNPFSTPNSYVPQQKDTIPSLISASLSAVDVDLRNALLGCVIVTGGASLLYGFTERLHNELQALYPNAKVRLHAAGNTAERKYGAWIGGSILGSLGTFHQLWISRAEWEEHGSGIVERRCK